MIFKHTWLKVIDGTKTQTRRLVKPGERLIQAEYFGGGYKPLWVENAKWKKVYTVGNYFAVQPDRGRASLARAFLTDIRREDVRKISDEDVKAEGFEHPYAFLKTWCAMHDPKILIGGEIIPVEWQAKLANRPSERYQAWVLTFQLAKDRK